MPIANVSLAVNLAAISGNVYINLPATSGISETGYWFYYKPRFANNTVYGANVVPYHWSTPLTLGSGGTELSMEGTIALITEPYYGANIQYHGSAIEWIGPGVNDITSTVEADAFFFGHEGSLSPATDDDAFYWDRIYTDANGTNWYYYQYHKHLPLFYPQFENGRQTMSGRGYINPTDKAYAWMINTRVTVMGVDYVSVLARIHTPSIGGAHNSHNDVTLPTVANKNYVAGGILRGLGNRFHAFYIAANGSQWDVFIRTYTQASLSFGIEVLLGTYDLADPTQNSTPTIGAQFNYPLRASAGTVYGQRIYFPVLFANVSVATNFDLKVWSFFSLDTISGGSLQQFTLASNVTVRPDCHLKVFGSNLYAIHSNISSGGVTLQTYDGNVWSQVGQVVSNGPSQYVRVHGFEYNSSDTKFYTMLSGNATGGGNTYVGRGLYNFELTGLFAGYPHLDYDFANNALISRPALTSGYLEYNQVFASFTKYNTTEPAGIAQGTNILEFGASSPKFINRNETILGGDEYYYQGIELRDGRKMFVGRIAANPGNFSTISTSGDFLVSLYSSTSDDPHHFAWGGAGDDYITSCYEDPTESKVWITGYTKSELVEKRDMKIHGFCRTFTDGANQIEFVDLVTDNTGNIYVAGNHSSGYVIVTKFNYNYDQVWQTSLNPPGNTAQAYGITVGTNSEHIYICGKTNCVNGSRDDAFIAKMMADIGDMDYVTLYKDGANANVYASSIDIVTNQGLDHIVTSIVKGNTSIVVRATLTTGAIDEQNILSNFVISRLRYDTGYANVGQFIFAGNDGRTISNGAFGMGRVEDQTSMFKWLRTYGNVSQSVDINDIRPLGGNAYAILGNVGVNGLAMKASVTGTYTVTKDWAKSTANAVFNAATIINGNIYAAGYTTNSGIIVMGSNEGLLAQFTPSGNVTWQNAFGHDMPERFLNITTDITGDNFITVGWSESHSFGRDGVLFRGWKEGFGTGTYHLAENPGMPYYYLASNLAITTDLNTITTQAAPLNLSGNLSTVGGTFTTFTADTYTLTNSGTNNYIFNGGGFVNAADPTLTLARGGTYTFINTTANHPFWIKTQYATGNAFAYNDGVTNNGANANVGGGVITFAVPEDAPDHLFYACGNHSGMRGNIDIVNNPSLFNGFTTFDYQFLSNFFDGSFGPTGVFMFFLGYIDLNEVQEYLNSSLHKERTRQGIRLEYTGDFFHLWEAGTVGDGSADDGNIFGYDIIVHSNGKVYAIGQTSGDLSKTNQGASGVYDYVLFEFDPATGDLEPYQGGTSLDEETYALCELANGKIAYTGRTTGNLGGTNQGGYDIFLGIFNPNSNTSTYYSTGSGLDDKGVNVHDLGGNVLAVTYSSYGLVGNATVQYGTEDIGVVLFNYNTNTWGNAYQVGSTTSEFFEQNGKPSTLTPDGRIGIVCSSAGNFADDGVTYGLLDICLGILDLNTGTWQKYQVGSSASDFASSIFGDGDRFLIAGYSRATFADGDSNAVWVEFDALKGLGAKGAVD